ncbi:MAG: preprotein translocase subunit YajC [Gaiellaceae bacterium]
MLIGASSGGSGVVFIIVIAFLVLYLIVIRPQRRRQAQQQQLTSELNVGDEVLTAGGIYGTITHVDEDRVTVEIAPKLEVQVARRAIAGVFTEPEPDTGAETEEPQDDGDEKWESAFDDEGSGADTSNQENRG